MVAIKRTTLQKQFEQFSHLSTDEEKKAFWENFNKNFEGKSEAEKQLCGMLGKPMYPV